MRRPASYAAIVALAGLAAAAVPGVAGAAGLYIPDTGTTARARGGAYVATADDPLAIVYNPAGLGDQTEKDQLLIDITALEFLMKFDRNPGDVPADGQGNLSSTNRPPVQVVPDILYTHVFDDGHGNKFVLGGGIHAPAGARYHFDSTGAQRYSVNDLFLTEAGLGISGGFHIHATGAARDFLAIGLTLETLITGVDQKFDITLAGVATTQPTEDPANDVPASLNVMQTLNPTGIIGVKLYPTDSLEFGIAYRPQVHLNMPGTFKSAQTPASPAHDEKVHFKSDLASILRIGGRYVKPAWDAELDFVMEDWSNHKKDEVVADDGNFFGSSTASLPRNWKSAFSVRAGGSYQVTTKVRGLAGVYYETSAVPKEYMDVGSFDAPKIGINLGAKYDINSRFTVAGNVSHTMLTAQTVSNSKQLQQSPYPPTLVPPADLTTIGNGKYSGNYEFLGVSLLTKF